MTTARDVVEMLRRHYQPEGRPPAGVFAPEIQAPDGRRRADLIWLPTTIAGGRGRGLVGHEVKVTRPDVLSELADPAKADPWARYCDRWWLVVAEPELVEGLAIPDQWGIMAPPSGRRTRSMTILRDAPRLNPVDTAPALATLAAWMLYRHADTEARLRADLDYRERTVAQLEAQIRALRSAGAVMPGGAAERVGRIVNAIEEQSRREDLWTRVDDHAVVRAVLDTEHVREAAAATRAAIDRIDNALADPLASARRHLHHIRDSSAAALADAGAR